MKAATLKILQKFSRHHMEIYPLNGFLQLKMWYDFFI